MSARRQKNDCLESRKEKKLLQFVSLKKILFEPIFTSRKIAFDEPLQKKAFFLLWNGNKVDAALDKRKSKIKNNT